MMICPYRIIVVKEGGVDRDNVSAFRVHGGIDGDQCYGDENHHDDVMIIEDGVSDRNC